MDTPLWVTLALTLKVASWATAINLVLGVAVGWLLARRRFVGREFVDALLAQIAKGAPVDVFASADQEAMDRADRQQLLAAGSRRNFVGNALVLIVPSDSTLGLKAAADLGRPAVKRVAIGNPASVPVGRYTKGALEAAKLWATVEPKAVLAQSVRQALDYVARGEVEAGLVYATDAALMKDKVRVVASVPTTTAITYPIAAIRSEERRVGKECRL